MKLDDETIHVICFSNAVGIAHMPVKGKRRRVNAREREKDFAEKMKFFSVFFTKNCIALLSGDVV